MASGARYTIGRERSEIELVVNKKCNNSITCMYLANFYRSASGNCQKKYRMSQPQIVYIYVILYIYICI